MSETALRYGRHRFPAAIIAHAVRLCLRFSLSLRMVEELLLGRGVEVSYETLRRWVAKFGPPIARGLRRRQAAPGRVWHLDEVRARVRGRRFWLWRAVDEHGLMLEEIPQPRRDRKAARRLIRRLLKTAAGPPKRIVPGKLACLSGGQARDRSGPRALAAQGVEQPGREQPPAVPIPRTGDAGPSHPGRAAALHRHALGHPQPLRPAPSPPPLRSRHPIPPPRSLRCPARSRWPRQLNQRLQTSHALTPLS